MKIILMSDVVKLGKAGDVLDVADGYARNFLVPRGVAAIASKGTLALVEQQRRAKSRREAEARADAEDLAKKLEGFVLTVPVKAGGNGRLFGTITNAQVAEAVRTALGVEIDRHKIEVPDNIKSLGTYQIEIKLAKNIAAKSSVKVIAASNT